MHATNIRQFNLPLKYNSAMSEKVNGICGLSSI